jgi:hypothetical protein
MGLIKTAIIAGAGIYAVNKFSERRQSRQCQKNAQQQQHMATGALRDEYYAPPQQYPGSQHDQKFMPLEFTDRRGSQQQPGQPQPTYFLNNDVKSRLPPSASNGDQDFYPREKDKSNVYVEARSSPPPPQYHDYRQYRQSGFVEPDEVSDSAHAGSVRSTADRRSGGADALHNIIRHTNERAKDLMERYSK